LRWRARAGAVAALAGGALLAASFAGTGDGAMLTAGLGALALFAGFVLLSPVVSGPATAFLGRPLTRLLGAPGTLGRRNAQRNPRRTAATASALMIGLALIGTVSVVTHSMTRSMDRQLEAGLPADFQIASTSRTAALGQPVLEAVAKVPGVRTAVPIRTVRLRLGGTAQDAMTGDPRRLVDHFRLRLEEGTVGGLVVDRATATAHGWRAGSAVPVEYQDGAKATLPLSGIYANVRTVLPTVPNAIVDERAAGPHYPGTGVQRIDVTGAPTRRALDAALARWPDVEAEDRATLRHEAAASIDLILDLTVALLMLSVVIAALGIANTLALSVIERTREIGVLRALGMQRRQLRRMIRYEAVVISLYGAVLGLGFGLLLGIAVRHAMAGEGVDTLAIPYARLAVQLPAAALIGTLAAAWPAHRAATMNPLEAITHTQT
ncbi:FtsX-like permease family protein, partial [Actinomadura fibrosa]